ncbi:MAG: acetoin utilization protein AcuC [Anaerosomatales bacterium]|nr:acetoin utilization protein AcuC [Anaerosomatales bacterium]MDT8434933.1 acetoin utilization protein AcuC [Anaerosomatales bacterium]
MSCILVYSDAMAGYDLGSGHPLKPERFTLAVDLMRAYGLLAEKGGPVALSAPAAPLPDDDLALVHDRAYIETVREASAEPARFTWRTRRGIGPGDTPAAPGLHEAAALIAAGTTAALRDVLDGDGTVRLFAVAGGLHHAHRDRAAGFCIYNDPAIAMAMALREHPGLRIAYLDIDAHHGDGVQEAFYDTSDVLTISLHESGRYLYPGTGREVETGTASGEGYALNVPLPPFANGACYTLAFDDVVTPALAAFRPDVLVAQCGADAHHADPLTHLGLTLADYRDLYARIISLANDHCAGRLVCTGGGGYGIYSAVPRAWTLLAATLAGVELPEEIPETWRGRSAALSGHSSPVTLTGEDPPPHAADPGPLLQATRAAILKVRQASPLLREE